MKVLVGERRSGLTTELCRWVMGGEPVGISWWSRMIFSPYPRFATDALRRMAFEWSDVKIGNMVVNGATIIVGRSPSIGIPPSVRYGVDDFEIWYPKYGSDCYERLGRPAVIAIHGNGRILNPRSPESD